MDTSQARFDTIVETTGVMEAMDGAESNNQVELCAYANHARCEVKILNREYYGEVSEFSPEVFVDWRLDDSKDAFVRGSFRVEVFGGGGELLGVREDSLSEYVVQPGYSFVPVVELDGECPFGVISRVEVYIDPEMV